VAAERELSDLWEAVSNVALAAEIALPLGMGVAILRFHLYEIDRIISRTLPSRR
jgi:hypothetical protein